MKYSLRSLMRFSLRDLFWITVVVALVLGWWLDHSKNQHLGRRLQVLDFEAKVADRVARKWSQDVEDIVVQLHEHDLMIEFKDGKCFVVPISAPAPTPAQP